MASSTPSWAEVSLKNLKGNFKELARLAKNSQVMPVVKANAYGHGSVPVSKALVAAGARFLAVAFVQEGVTLRKAGLSVPILVLTPTLPAEISDLFRYRLTPQVSSFQNAKNLDRAARKQKIGKLKVHLKVDTGMGRVGVQARRVLEELGKIRKLKNIEVEALYTHLATADWSDPKYAWRQITLFRQALEKARRQWGMGFHPATHVANSASLITYYPQSGGTWVRPGIALYGIYPGPGMKGRLRLKPIMGLKTRVLHVKTLEKGDSVSYGRTFTAKKKITLATLGIGYADGLLRSLSNKGSCLVHGKKVPLVGTICMDMCMADVSRAPQVKAGDIATLFGQDGKAFLSVEEQAARAGTISYELLCAVGERVPRIYRS